MKIGYIIFDFEKTINNKLIEILKEETTDIYFASKYNTIDGADCFVLKSENERSETFTHEFFSILKNVSNKSKFTHLVILNSKNFPIRPIKEFHAHIREFFDSDHVNIFGGTAADKIVDRKYYSMLQSNNTLLNTFFRILKIKRKRAYGFVIHVGSPYCCITRKTAENAIAQYSENKDLKKSLRYLANSPLYYISYILFRAIENPMLQKDSFIASTSKITHYSQLFYDDHINMLDCSKYYFVYATSKSSHKLTQLYTKSDRQYDPKIVQPYDIYDKFICSIDNSNKRLPGIYRDIYLQELHYNTKKYTVIISSHDTCTDIIKEYFDQQNYILLGEIFNKNEIHYYATEHPGYSRDSIALRDYKIQNFMYDMVNYYKKEIIIIIPPQVDKKIIDLLAEDPNATFYGLLHEKNKKFLTANIQVTSCIDSQYYSVEHHDTIGNRTRELCEADMTSLRIFLQRINSVSLIKQKLVSIL